MNQIPEPVRIALKVIRVFENLKIPYFIDGSLASSLYGVARSTLDADIVADINGEQVKEFMDKLGPEFFADELSVQDAIRMRTSFNLLHYESMFKIDVFIPKQRAFDQIQFERRELRALAPNSADKAFVCSLEDMILAKLEWYRLGNEVSDRQWKDIIGMMKLQRSELDLKILSEWAAKLGVGDLLEKALKEST